MVKIKWTEKASSNLQAIHEYISKGSQVYATRFIKTLIESTSKIKTMPYCGRIVPEFGNINLREIIFRNYRIVYRILNDNEVIEFLAVVHGARLIREALGQEGMDSLT